MQPIATRSYERKNNPGYTIAGKKSRKTCSLRGLPDVQEGFFYFYLYKKKILEFLLQQTGLRDGAKHCLCESSGAEAEILLVAI